MRLFRQYAKGLAWQVFKSILVIYFAITLIVTVVQMAAEYVNMRQQLELRLQNLERIYYPALAAALWEINPVQVADLQDKVLALSFVSAIRIVDEQGVVSFKSKQSDDNDALTIKHTFSLNYRVSNADTHLADVTLMTSNAVIMDLLKLSYQMTVVNALIKSLALTLLFFLVFKKRLSEPLGRLTERIDTVKPDALIAAHVDLGQAEENELSQLERAFNAMLEVLDSERKAHASKLAAINQDLERQVQRRTEQLALANQQLEALVRTDPLTGLANRRYFFDQAAVEIQRALRGGSLALAMLDLDHFKQVNDTWGHAVGDEVLRDFAANAKVPLRTADFLARIGGEEFAILLPNSTMDGAMAVAQRIIERVRAQAVEVPGGPVFYTVSIGLATFHGGDDNLPELMKRADAALYQAKALGRNRAEMG